MWNKNSRSYDLNLRATGRILFEKICSGVFNNSKGKLKVTSCIIGGDDTVMIYHLSLSRKDQRKPTKDQINFVRIYILGLADGMGMTTMLTGGGVPSHF
jgi:hypothetical protein